MRPPIVHLILQGVIQALQRVPLGLPLILLVLCTKSSTRRQERESVMVLRPVKARLLPKELFDTGQKFIPSSMVMVGSGVVRRFRHVRPFYEMLTYSSVHFADVSVPKKSGTL